MSDKHDMLSHTRDSMLLIISTVWQTHLNSMVKNALRVQVFFFHPATLAALSNQVGHTVEIVSTLCSDTLIVLLKQI
jgi:uncharacterized protein YaeQ